MERKSDVFTACVMFAAFTVNEAVCKTNQKITMAALAGIVLANTRLVSSVAQSLSVTQLCLQAFSHSSTLFSFPSPQFGDSQQLRLVRILRSTVMVRVGGGWMALDEFLVKNDPCRGEFTSSAGVDTGAVFDALYVQKCRGLLLTVFALFRTKTAGEHVVSSFTNCEL